MAATASYVFLKRYNGYLNVTPEEAFKEDYIQKKVELTKSQQRLVEKITVERVANAVKWLCLGLNYFNTTITSEKSSSNSNSNSNSNNNNNNENNNTNNDKRLEFRKSVCSYCMDIVTALFEWERGKNDEPCATDCSSIVSTIDELFL